MEFTNNNEVNAMKRETLKAKFKKRGIVLPGRLIVTSFLILVQIAFFILVEAYLKQWSSIIYGFVELLSLIIVFIIVNDRSNPSYKLTWIVFILAAPFVGGIAFFLWGNGKVRPILKKRLEEQRKLNRRHLWQDPAVVTDLHYEDTDHARQSQFLFNESGFPVYGDTTVEYLAPGEKFLPRMLEELKNAEKYIFLEYFIVAEGKMWNAIYDVLRAKAKAGVEVRLIFDDFGSISRQSQEFVNALRKDGIYVLAFNRVRPSVDLFLNNRDHRKVCVIDGYVSMTGGLNIADEYINETHPHGNWMDCAVIMKGPAATSFAVAFCEMWSSMNRTCLDPAKYIVDTFPKAKGFVQPYVENPLDNKKFPAEGIYRQILGTAKDHVYIMSPYLILDNTMTAALKSAAQAGIDVRIITPKIKDKWYVHPVTQFNYQQLLEAGVRVFEYAPGFIHSKVFVSDDAVATCGTVNMDYRSFYFHFECGVWMCNVPAVTDIKEHFLSLQEESHEITLQNWSKRPVGQRLIQAILNVFAPFM